MAAVTKQIDGESEGFGGETVFVMTDGSIYRQVQYHYAYRYQYRPEVMLINDREIVLPGIPRAVRVERLR
jgi:hypothetical protein